MPDAPLIEQSPESILLAIAAIFVLGVGSQWLASRLKVPSILLLLATGILAGPVLGLIDPDNLFRELLLPTVSLAVAVVLFEGSLSLRLSDLKAIGQPLVMLLSVGVGVTWILCTSAAVVVLQFELLPALLLGAILTVTGPTVIGPMLREIRPTGQVGPISRWEGIVVDPIGAVLAVLVFSTQAAVRTERFQDAVRIASGGFLLTTLIGIIVGLTAATLLKEMLRRHLIADHLQSPFALMIVVAAFTASNVLHHESGLVTVTVMGVVLANQHTISIRHIVEFKENLSVLLISSLFILLSARLNLQDFTSLGWRGPAFVAFVILVARPISVMLSTFGSGLKMNERLFLSWLAPRGIVAAAVASVFALELGPGTGLVPAVFLVIVGTVLVYGLTAGPVARRLGLSVSDPQGVLIASAHPGARAIAKVLASQGIAVRLVDTNAYNLRQARMEGMQTLNANVLSDSVLEILDLGGIGRLFALTPNDEVNSLACDHFTELFGRKEVYRLSVSRARSQRQDKSAEVLSGRVLFDNAATYEALDLRFAAGAVVKATKLTNEFGLNDLLQRYGDSALILFAIDDKGKMIVCTADLETTFHAGQTIIALVDEQANDKATATSR
ncbi:MAG: cation:proton antiporter [Planctomycetaceae bacterium]